MLLTGSLLIALMGLATGLGAPIPRWVYEVTGIGFLLWAAFRVWEKEYVKTAGSARPKRVFLQPSKTGDGTVYFPGVSAGNQPLENIKVSVIDPLPIWMKSGHSLTVPFRLWRDNIGSRFRASPLASSGVYEPNPQK